MTPRRTRSKASRRPSRRRTTGSKPRRRTPRLLVRPTTAPCGTSRPLRPPRRRPRPSPRRPSRSSPATRSLTPT
ncbi:hypothetical protein D4739_07455 [Nocardioides cavernaquae]|uniref:Uncharacterized protein n=1 Tax=Nocardioides cavernaquae TaxID=2321396 RepID=A0A3A5H5W8_9ACTN|nr:hypothetical protein D4739_07455 [Nocardioides cavernaquae]